MTTCCRILLVGGSLTLYCVLAVALAMWLDSLGVHVLLIALLNYVLANLVVGPALILATEKSHEEIAGRLD